MNLNDPVRWAVIDLLKTLDRSHGGREHAQLLRIAQTLGVEIPPVDPGPDPAPDGEETDGEAEGNGQGSEDRVYRFLAAQAGPVGLGQIIRRARPQEMDRDQQPHPAPAQGPHPACRLRCLAGSRCRVRKLCKSCAAHGVISAAAQALLK